MHTDDFYGNNDHHNTNNSNLPSSIDTLDDAIAYLQRARQTMGGKTKFRLVSDNYEYDSDEYSRVDDVILTGRSSLMKKSHNKDENEFVLFVY